MSQLSCLYSSTQFVYDVLGVSDIHYSDASMWSIRRSVAPVAKCLN